MLGSLDRGLAITDGLGDANVGVCNSIVDDGQDFPALNRLTFPRCQLRYRSVDRCCQGDLVEWLDNAGQHIQHICGIATLGLNVKGDQIALMLIFGNSSSVNVRPWARPVNCA